MTSNDTDQIQAASRSLKDQLAAYPGVTLILIPVSFTLLAGAKTRMGMQVIGMTTGEATQVAEGSTAAFIGEMKLS